MGLLDNASNHTDQADLVILNHVETYRDQKQPATPSAVASLIGGAPVAKIRDRLLRLAHYGLIDTTPSGTSFQLTQLGCELLMRDLIGWSPSIREQRRRDLQLISAANGSG